MIDLPPLPVPVLMPVTALCVQAHAKTYALHHDLLWAILIVEGGTVGEKTENSNGTFDSGPAQINSIHLDELKALGITEESLQNDGCENVRAQAHILKSKIANTTIQTEEDYLLAIAGFHSKTPKHAKRYVTKLKEAFTLLYKDN